MTVDLSNNIERKHIVLQMQSEIDLACKQHFSEAPRKHLGASIIGHDCSAYAWNTFRWLKPQDTSGQGYRLFNRGHLEEARFVQWLSWIGFEVRELDPETKKQFRIGGAKGHFGGSLDSLMKPPERYGLDAMVWLGEFKTHSELSFTKLAGPKPKLADRAHPRTGGKGVFLAKPEHYKQMCCYGRAYQLRFGLYCAVNKNTDELYFEIVELDWNVADDLYRKADMIVSAQEQPPKVAHTETFFDCQYCDFKGICHRGESPVKNCRSCVNAHAIDDGKWWCALYSEASGPLPDDVIAVGCNSWKRIV